MANLFARIFKGHGREGLPEFSPLRRLVAGGTLIVFAAMLTGQALQNVGVLLQMAGNRLQAWRMLETALDTAGAGLDVLPPAIGAAVDLLKAQDAQVFNLSPGLRADDFMRQRIAEVAWPRVIDTTAPYVLRLESEPTTCETVAKSTGVALDRCP